MLDIDRCASWWCRLGQQTMLEMMEYSVVAAPA
jgi:hypothetical protein